MSNPYILLKYGKLKTRLYNKIKMSATPIQGFVVGLSGTDSILTYMLLCDLANDTTLFPGQSFKVHGVHYVDNIDVKDTFQKVAEPFLISKYGHTIECVELASNVDQLRWADLHIRAVNQPSLNPRALPQRFWVASAVNATEKALGTYSIMSKSASIEPIGSLWKSEVLDICEHLGVPEQILKNSRIPDCACGREEFASENIELIDWLLRDNVPEGYSIEKVREAMDYIRNTKKEFGFKARTPYNV